MGSEKKKRTGYKRLGFWLSITTAVLVVVGMIILTLLPYAMERGAEHLLLRNGASAATIADIDFNPMTGHLTVFDLLVEGSNSDRVTMERLVVKMDLFPLLKKRISFREISLTGFFLDIRQEEDGTLTFAGLSIPESQATGTEEPEEDKETTPWGLGLKDLDVKEFTVHLITPDFDETVVLQHLNLTDFETWTPEKHGDHILRVDLLGGTVDIEGTVKPFADPVIVSTRIGFRNMDLDRIMPYIKDTPVESLSGSLSGRGQVNAALNLQPGIAVASTVRFDIFSEDMDIKAATEDIELGFLPGSLNTGVSIETSINMGDNPAREFEFTATTSLNDVVTQTVSKGTAININQDTLSFKISGSYSDTGTVDFSNLRVTSGLSLKGLILKDGDSPTELFRLGSFDVENIQINGPDDIRIPLTRFKDIALLPRNSSSPAKDEPGQVLSLGDMEIAGVSLAGGSHLAVEAVQMESLNAWILREQGGDLEALNILGEVMGTAPETAEEGRAEGGAAADGGLTLALGSFSLAGANSLTFRDLDVSPPFEYEIDSLAVEVLDLDTAPGSGPATVTVDLGMGKYSGINMDATVQPPWRGPDIEMTMHAKAIDLPPLTPYTTLYLGYTLYSGHLDTDLNMVVQKGTLNAQTEVTVNRIEMEAVKKEDEQRAEERLGIPVKTALSLLKDNNDDIHLKIPIEGDLTDPKFKISDVIVGATGQALKRGVTAYYKSLGATLITGGLIPPGTFGILGKVFSGVTTMTFEPVVFDPMAPELTEQSKTYLNLMSEKLASKPKVRLVMCGKVTVEDILAIRQTEFDAAMAAAQARTSAGIFERTDPPSAAADTVPGEENNESYLETVTEPVPAGPPTIEEAPLTDSEKERLIELAKQRALAVKDYLVETGGLDPERLFVCYSDVDTEKVELPPRVDLSI